MSAKTSWCWPKSSATRWPTSRWSCWRRPGPGRGDRRAGRGPGARRGRRRVRAGAGGGRPHRGGQRSAIGRLSRRSPTWPRCAGRDRAEQPRAVLIGWHVDRLGRGADAGRAAAGPAGRPAARRSKRDGDGLVVTASFCGGKMMAEVQVDASPAILMILPGSFRPTGTQGRATRRTPRARSSRSTPGAVRFEDWILPEAGDVDITQQDVLVAVGRGIQQKDNVELAEELAAGSGRRGLRLAAGGRPGLAARHAPGGQVGHDRQAQAVSGAGDQRRAGASGRHEGGRPDHRGQHRPEGADFRRRPLRGGGRRAGPVAGAGRSRCQRHRKRVERMRDDTLSLGPSCGTSRTGRKSRSTC